MVKAKMRLMNILMEHVFTVCVQATLLPETPTENGLLAIYAPKIYTGPCIMFWIRAYPLRGEVGGGWALKIESFLGPVKWHRANRRVPFGAQGTRCHFTRPKKPRFPGPNPLPLALVQEIQHVRIQNIMHGAV
jgi:hypothetical protein